MYEKIHKAIGIYQHYRNFTSAHLLFNEINLHCRNKSAYVENIHINKEDSAPTNR